MNLVYDWIFWRIFIWTNVTKTAYSPLYYLDKRYKDCLLTTMIHRAYQLSSTPTAFSAECNKLRSISLNLDYPIKLINSAINKFLRNIDNVDAAKNTRDDSSTIMVLNAKLFTWLCVQIFYHYHYIFSLFYSCLLGILVHLYSFSFHPILNW